MEKAYDKLLTPPRVSRQNRKAIKDIQLVLAIEGCAISPALFVNAVLVNDKKFVKHVLKMKRHILEERISDGVPVAFHIKRQIAMLENNNKMSLKQKTSIMTLLDFVCKKGVATTWIDEYGKYWTLNDYYNHFLVTF